MTKDTARPKPRYEELKAELDNIVEQLQADDVDVDAALSLYKRGREIVEQLQEYLKTAENTVHHLDATDVEGT